MPGEVQQRSNNSGAQAAHGDHPFVIASIDVRLERLSRGFPRVLMTITPAGQSAQVVSYEVRGDVLHAPVAGERRSGPVVGGQRIEQRQKCSAFHRDQVEHEDRFRRAQHRR